MVGEDFHQCRLIFRFQQVVDGTRGQRGKGFVGWGEDCERPRTFQRVNQAGSFDGDDQGGVVLGVDGVFDDVFRRLHGGSADHGIFLRVCMDAHTAERQCHK